MGVSGNFLVQVVQKPVVSVILGSRKTPEQKFVYKSEILSGSMKVLFF